MTALSKDFPRPRPPTALERDYRGFLLRRVKQTHAGLMSRLGPLLDRLAPAIDANAARAAEERKNGARQDSDRLDAVSADLAQIVDVVELERAKWITDRRPSEAELSKRARSISKYSAGQQDDVVRKVYQIGTFAPLAAEGQIATWSKANVNLITSIDSRYFDDIQRVATEAVRTGRDTESLRREIQRRYEVSEGRARLIARDQVSKLNGQIAETRQRQLGARRYMWSTVGDERVRDRHKELDGHVFSWDDPPVINDQGDRGHPGDDYQDRCISIPVFDDDDLEAMQAEQVARQAREEQGLLSSPITTGEIIPIARRQPTSKWFRELQRKVQGQSPGL